MGGAAAPGAMEQDRDTRLPILLVDDEPDSRDALKYFLEMQGYPVVAANDADEALQHLRGGVEPCLILLDLLMPGKTGFQFRYEQVKEPRFATIPVVIYSAHADIINAAIQLGAAAYLEKPIELPTLLKVIETHRLK